MSWGLWIVPILKPYSVAWIDCGRPVLHCCNMELATMLSKHTVLDDVYLTDMFVNLFIPISSAAGIVFAIWLWIRVSAVKVRPTDSTQRTENGREYLLEEESRGEAEVRTHRMKLYALQSSLYAPMPSRVLSRIPPIRGRQLIQQRPSPG